VRRVDTSLFAIAAALVAARLGDVIEAPPPRMLSDLPPPTRRAGPPALRPSFDGHRRKVKAHRKARLAMERRARR
jgi:hypothetical protein